MKAEIISVETPTHPLDGLYYEPAGEAKNGVMLMHGNTMNFYVGALRFLPPSLVGAGYSCLAYNRRGHDVLSTYASRALVGGAYQTVAEAIEDNELAGQWIAARGHDAPVVAGHSHGGTLAAYYGAHHPETPALVLISAHVGAEKLMLANAAAGNFAADRHEEFLRIAEEKVANGEGADLMMLPGWYYVISAATFLDACVSMPSLFELAERITCPVLFIVGDKEPTAVYPAEAFAEACAGPCEVRIIEDCDHFYGGHESEIADMVAGFVAGHT